MTSINLRKSLLVYQPQAVAARSLLGEMGIERKLCPISDAVQLSGLEGWTFVNVINHPSQPPAGMREMVQAHGFLTMDLSDEPLRRRQRMTMKNAG